MTEGALVLWIVLLTIVLQVLVRVSRVLHRYMLEWSSPQAVQVRVERAVQAKRRKMFPEEYKTPLEQLKRWGRLEHSNEMNLPCSNPTCQHCYPQKQAIKTTGKAAYIPHVYEVGTMAQMRVMTAVPTPILGRGITYEPCPPTPAEYITY